MINEFLEKNFPCQAGVAGMIPAITKSLIMAQKNSRLRENVPGAYYVTDECIDCDMCRVTAPSIFDRNDMIGLSVVFHQPENESERLQAEEALADCPVTAIGNDGEK